ncbi:MAG: molecular chaperone HtpG [Planctomycetes bacterium]|nr:molecular chaperone HtpG [Planctomycetota bacterium]
MTTQTETRSFQAETSQLLDLMIHSLYSHKEIFLRELISNASDALDKRRLLGLTDAAVRGDDEGRILIEADPASHTLVVSDDGIGMTRDEVVENIGTIARSGTKEFIRTLKEARKSGEIDAELIGQFGVGFYSAFMVADEVILETRKAGTDEATRWTSKGDGSYTIEPCEKDAPGTRITLVLRPKESEDESWQDFTDEWTLRSVVKRYSDFVEHPVVMEVEREEGEGDEKRSVRELVTLNSRKPLWTRPKAEISEQEYKDFYTHLSHDWNDPLETIHFKAEGTHEYTALLYVPKTRSHEMLDPQQRGARVSLYVKRVLVQAECEELLPPWLRFVRGVVDSADLPLNVSRETLQHARQMGQIRKHLVKKVVETLGKVLADRRDDYVAFWEQLGPVVKEGLVLDEAMRDELAKTCLFHDTHDETLTTLGEYVERMPFTQNAIYYVTASDLRTARSSPHLEALKKKGLAALLLVDPVDEFVVDRLHEFDGKPLVSLDRGELDLGDDADDESSAQLDEKQKELQPALDAVQKALDEHVSSVRLSRRLDESPAVLVGEQGGLSPQMERILRASGQEVPKGRRVLELNAEHPVVQRLLALAAERGDGAGDGESASGDGEGSARFAEFAEVLLGQALLAEGNPPPDPARFAKLLGRLMAGG